MKKIAIRNIDPSRDSEIIQIFTDLGGRNVQNYTGCNYTGYYYINGHGEIMIEDKNYLRTYKCFDSIDEYNNSLNILDTSGSLKSEDLNPIYLSKTINYTDI